MKVILTILVAWLFAVVIFALIPGCVFDPKFPDEPDAQPPCHVDAGTD